MGKKLLLSLLLALTCITVSAQQDYSSLVTAGDASLISWTTSEDYPFTISNGMAYSSNAGVANSESFLEGTFTVQTDYYLCFDFMASTGWTKTGMYDWSADMVYIDIDGVRKYSISETMDDSLSLDLEKGTHTFRISYVKDSLADVAQDRAGIGNIRLYPRRSDFSTLSPDGSVTDFLSAATCGWTCYDGKAQSDNKGDADTSATLYIKVNTTKTQGLVFNYEVSAEENDRLQVFVDEDAEPALNVGGEQSGKFAHNLEAGSHVVKLVYAKDAEGQAAQDRAYITNVRLLDVPYTETVKNMICVAHTTYTDSLTTDPRGEHAIHHNTQFTFCSDGEVLIDSLMRFSDAFTLRTLHAQACDGKIVMEVPSSSSNTYVLADHNNPDYPDSKFWTILITGTVNDYGQVYPDSPLTFTINADTTVIKPDGPLVAQDVYEYGTYYIFNLYSDATYIASLGRSIISAADTVAVPQMHVGQTQTVQLVVYNNGDATATVNAQSASANELSVTPSAFMVAAYGESDTVSVAITPAQAGAFDQTVTFRATDGSSKTVHFVGDILPELNYSDIVKTGKEYILWSSSEDYPWDVVDGTAFSTNKGINNTESALYAKLNVPDDCIAMFTADAHYSCAYNDSLIITHNGESVTRLTGAWYSANGDYQLKGNLIGGTQNDYAFVYRKAASGTAGDDQATLKNVCLKMFKKQDYNVITEDSEADFGTVASRQEKALSVTLTNVGMKDLQVTEIVGDDVFSGTVPTASAATFGEISVTLTCNAPKDGHYEGDVVIKTTAGDVQIRCSADAENVLYLGGEFPFTNYTGAYNSYYPFNPADFGFDITTTSLYIDESLKTLKDCKIQSITYHLLDNYYLENTEYQPMTMAWSVGGSALEELSQETTPDGLTEVYSGDVLQFASKDLTVNFSEPYLWDGGDKLVVKFQSTGGRQNNFTYITAYNTSYTSSVYNAGTTSRTDKYCPCIKLTYELPSGETTAIESVENGTMEEPTQVKYYDATGIQHDQPVKGLNIVVKKLKDGSTTTRKVYLR